MTTTTANKIRGRSHIFVLGDEWDALRYAYTALDRNLMLDIPKEIAGTIQTWLHKTAPPWGYARRTYRYEEFRMVRLNTKEYGFILHNDGKLSASYKCSWIEAQRRFKMLLLTWRLACA